MTHFDEFASGVPLGRRAEARGGGADDGDDGLAFAQRAGHSHRLRPAAETAAAASSAISASCQVRAEGVLRRPEAPPPSPPPQQRQLGQDLQAPQIEVLLSPTATPSAAPAGAATATKTSADREGRCREVARADRGSRDEAGGLASRIGTRKRQGIA